MRYGYLTRYASVFAKMTGLQQEAFDALWEDVLPRFGAAEEARLSRPGRQRAIGGGRESKLDGRDQVLLTVIWLRQYPTHEVLAYLFGVSDSTVSRIVQRVLPLLEQSGRDTMRLPDPGRKRRRQWDELLADTPELAVIVDTFEQRVQRPKAAAERDSWYSGKKRTHTIKSQVAVDECTGQLVAVADSVKGPVADLTVLKASHLLDALPEGVGCLGDSAYQGIRQLHPLGASPRKKPWGKHRPRPPEDVAYNRAFAQRRVVVENIINRLRRFQALTQTDRQHRQAHTARVVAVAGLVNRQSAHFLPVA